MDRLSRFVAPVLLLAAAFGAVYFGDALAPALGRWKLFLPYLVLAGAAVVAVTRKRVAALFALATLTAAYAAQQHALDTGLGSPGARSLYAALALVVPINLALAAWLPERGLRRRGGAILALVLVVEIALGAWLWLGAGVALTDWAWRRILPVPAGFGALPQAGVVLLVISFVAALAAAFASRSFFPPACAGAIIAVAVAVHVPTAAYTSSAFLLAAALMFALALSVGAPGRRR